MMEPGRSLDGAIAEKLGVRPGSDRNPWIPHYSTDNGTALGLLEEMIELDDVWGVEISKSFGKFECYLQPKRYEWFGQHEKLPGAIALAVARALGVEE